MKQFQHVVVVKETPVSPQHADPHRNAPTGSDYIPAMGFNKRKMEDARRTEGDNLTVRIAVPHRIADPRQAILFLSFLVRHNHAGSGTVRCPDVARTE